MTRDLELIRHILKTIEALPLGQVWNTQQIEGYPDDVVKAHVVLLRENNFIKGVLHKPHSGIVCLNPTLDWAGYELLKTINSDNTWSKIKDSAIESTVSMTLSAALEWVKQEAKIKLGIP